MSKPAFRQLTVHSTHTITPNMQRVVFTGEALNDFPLSQESAYIKLMFDAEGQPLTAMPEENNKTEKPRLRSYTIRDYNPQDQLLTVDFVLHGHGDDQGPAGRWAQVTAPGDIIMIKGPGPKKLVDNSADWFLLVGDMTALPAICCNLEQLPADARGYAIIEVADARDKQSIRAPEGMELIWLVNADLNPQTSLLSNTVKELEWLTGSPAVWSACEFSNMRQLRAYFKTERNVERERLYISSYWKKGFSDEQHKVAKRKDAEAFGAL